MLFSFPVNQKIIVLGPYLFLNLSCTHMAHLLSMILLMLFRSFTFALRIMAAIKGANNLENPVGLPLLRSVI